MTDISPCPVCGSNVAPRMRNAWGHVECKCELVITAEHWNLLRRKMTVDVVATVTTEIVVTPMDDVQRAHRG